ncbi:MAG: nickel pincer cofactor biosynthesis protein LarC [Planctomycetes bacterium]|nr:nickel pincer cofactor biosynthesis protein LarC [Planctomycetota bacterium]
MSLIYVDAFSGASGDMLLGALLDAGLAEADLRACLARLPLEGYDLAVRREKRLGIEAVRAEVRLAGEAGGGPGRASAGAHAHGHKAEVHGRRLPEILAMIAAAGLPGRAAGWADAVFRRLAQAEARVHGSRPDEVHFHEVGAVDSIVDICGVCAGLALLGMERLISSPLPMGSGYVKTAHGLLPVPAPAVVELVRGSPTRACEETGELTTPTGAAILVTLAERFGPMPAMIPERIGYGAGARQGEQAPNVVRVIVGRAADGGPADEADAVWLLEANLDDATGETLGAAAQRLLAAGALDVWLVPATMKKGRPGVVLACLVDDAGLRTVEETIFRETTTFGVRRTQVMRAKLAREHVAVDTPYGPVRIKVGRRGGRVLAAMPEYEDCLRLAGERGAAFRDVYEAARAAWAARQG